MKYTLLLAATALLGTSSAKVHKLKLNKVPLSEQLVSNYLMEHGLSCFVWVWGGDAD